MTYKIRGVGTTHIAVRAATNVLHAVRFATDRGQPLNTEVIVAWHRLGIGDDIAGAASIALRRSVSQAWKYRDRAHGRQLGPLVGVVVQENPANDSAEPLRNTHWLVRVPPAFRAEFEQLVGKFLRKIAGSQELGRSLLIRSVEAPGTLAKYLLKGVDPAYGAHLHIRPEDQGFIGGRGRTSVSRLLSRAARKRDGWTRKRRPRSR